jgi:hypothetical protein
MKAAIERDDPETRVPNRSLGVPCRLTTAERARPKERVDTALHRSEQEVLGPDVLRSSACSRELLHVPALANPLAKA